MSRVEQKITLVVVFAPSKENNQSQSSGSSGIFVKLYVAFVFCPHVLPVCTNMTGRKTKMRFWAERKSL
jgi:hypothetical protein